MVSINRVDYLIAMGNTYGNLALLKQVGGRFDNGSRTWSIPIARHPLNNTKQKAKLLAMLNQLEENGVRFTAWYIDGATK